MIWIFYTYMRQTFPIVTLTSHPSLTALVSVYHIVCHTTYQIVCHTIYHIVFKKVNRQGLQELALLSVHSPQPVSGHAAPPY